MKDIIMRWYDEEEMVMIESDRLPDEYKVSHDNDGIILMGEVGLSDIPEYRCVHCELMIYSGQLDINGTRIFEGDITVIEGVNNEYFRIIWQESHSGLFMQIISDGVTKGMITPIMASCEVVGHIYDKENGWA